MNWLYFFLLNRKKLTTWLELRNRPSQAFFFGNLHEFKNNFYGGGMGIFSLKLIDYCCRSTRCLPRTPRTRARWTAPPRCTGTPPPSTTPTAPGPVNFHPGSRELLWFITQHSIKLNIYCSSHNLHKLCTEHYSLNYSLYTKLGTYRSLYTIHCSLFMYTIHS